MEFSFLFTVLHCLPFRWFLNILVLMLIFFFLISHLEMVKISCIVDFFKLTCKRLTTNNVWLSVWHNYKWKTSIKNLETLWWRVPQNSRLFCSVRTYFRLKKGFSKNSMQYSCKWKRYKLKTQHIKLQKHVHLSKYFRIFPLLHTSQDKTNNLLT